MNAIVCWLALAVGVDAGYEPAPDGHLEYIIQIEPQLVGTLGVGDIASEVLTTSTSGTTASRSAAARRTPPRRRPAASKRQPESTKGPARPRQKLFTSTSR